MPYRTAKSMAIALILSLLMFSSTLTADGGGRKIPARVLRSEFPDDAYIHVPREAQRTSPAYRALVPGFFMTQVNVNASGSNILGDAGNEPSIAVDPTDPNRMAIGWRQFDTVQSNFR